ncbi:hypothetical protein GCM10009544_35290 [Streptomyces stramineus]|uniref:Uncharacterized protein n=1 Tax=Streptomyces stramineus TaxID=173861 RepID=A0ABN1A8F8_9ACTN
MVGVVEEEDQVAQADQGVGALAGPGEALAVAVHVADHVNPEVASHTDHPRRCDAAFGRSPTCGYFRVTQRTG